jgi:hypothetical protein
MAAYSTIWAWLVAVSIIAFVVVNSRILFPWPLSRSQLRRSYPFARLASVAAVIVGGGLGAAGAIGAPVVRDWWQAFFLLAVTGIANLLALKCSIAVGSRTE